MMAAGIVTGHRSQGRKRTSSMK
jgi:hypothetical protein